MSKGNYKIICGDITNPTGEGVKIIPHIISDLGVCGAGVAKAIVEKWPEAKFGLLSDKEKIKLGFVSYWWKEKENIVIASMVAQKGLRNKDNPNPIKYIALVDAMKEIVRFILDFPNDSFSIHCPKFGSGLAGGNWKFIETLIKEIWVDNGIDVMVYEYKKGD